MGRNKNQEEQEITPAYNPATCILEGACCEFEDVTYAYCGKYCGYKQDAGGANDGSDHKNQLDACCYQHDVCLADNLKSTCDCHMDFINCSESVPHSPGFHTIRAGIAAAMSAC